MPLMQINGTQATVLAEVLATNNDDGDVEFDTVQGAGGDALVVGFTLTTVTIHPDGVTEDN